jgi:hypothetical protein
MISVGREASNIPPPAPPLKRAPRQPYAAPGFASEQQFP